MKKYISGLIVALAMVLSLLAVPANAATYVSCSRTLDTGDLVFVGDSAARTSIWYQICTDKRNGQRWVQNMSMDLLYNYKGNKVNCGPAGAFEGVKWDLHFRDKKGNGDSKSVYLKCSSNTVGKKWVGLGGSGSKKLYYTGGRNGVPRWYGTVTEKWSLGKKDVRIGTGNDYAFKASDD